MNASGTENLVTFWGTRGSIPTPGRSTEKYGGNTPCVSVKCSDAVLIFDAGTGIRNLGMELFEDLAAGKELPPINIFLSHTHWDHIQGIPFFKPAFLKGSSVNIYGFAGKGKLLEEVLEGQMREDYFPVGMDSLPADIKIHELSEGTFEIGDVRVSWEEQIHHPGGSIRYSVNFGGKKIVYASDVELDLMGQLEDSSEAAEQRAKYLKFIEKADLLIADGQYTAEEYETKKGWGHTSLPVILDLAYESEVKSLAIFHHDPLCSDRVIDELYAEYGSAYFEKNPSMQVFWAREGVTISV